jgi:hypothetical protein
LAWVIAKHFAEQRDGLIQIVVAGGCFRPNPRDQLRAAKTLAVMLDQHQERVKDLRGEDNGFAFPRKAASDGVEAKRAKFVKFPRHIRDLQLFISIDLPAGGRLG